jgi:cyclopropane fatty-acyl-phospholipid synthase-like methyltransferase
VGRIRGCHLTLNSGIEKALAISLKHYAMVGLGDLTGKTVIEIGPGDNLGLALCSIANGASSVVALEKFATVQQSPELQAAIYRHFDYRGTAVPSLVVKSFEEYDGPPVDLIYSVDVLENVDDVPRAFKEMARLLKPGGKAIHAIDFCGHNAFMGTGLGFLTCPEWLYQSLHSHLVTSNRVRYGEVLRAIETAGMHFSHVQILERATDAHVESIRPRLQKRWRDFPASDLRILQAVVTATKTTLPGSRLPAQS